MTKYASYNYSHYIANSNMKLGLCENCNEHDFVQLLKFKMDCGEFTPEFEKWVCRNCLIVIRDFIEWWNLQ